MSIITGSHRSDRRETQRLRNIHIAAAILGSFLCLDRGAAAEIRPGKRTTLRVPRTDSKLVVDGKLEEPCWKDAAETGPLRVAWGAPAKSTTEAFLLRDAHHLYVGVRCTSRNVADGEVKPGGPSRQVESVELLIDSNGDGNSYYLIGITPENGGKVTCSYHEHTPPWHDRTWQPQFQSAAAKGSGGS